MANIRNKSLSASYLCDFFINYPKIYTGCTLYAYCLMSNHVHLLIEEQNNDVATIIKRLGVVLKVDRRTVPSSNASPYASA